MKKMNKRKGGKRRKETDKDIKQKLEDIKKREKGRNLIK